MKQLRSFIIISLFAAIATNLVSKIQNNNIIDQKAIAIIVPSYNNKHFYKRNLRSIYNQKYENYRIIYVNDASPDGTGQLVEQFIKDAGQEKRTILINNAVNIGALANTYKAIHMCDDHEIIVMVDGDDWIKHDTVLQKINNIYQDENVWLTYGQYEELHYSATHDKFFTRPGICAQIPPNIVRAHAYREDDWVSAHLRTFYAGLFKQIKLKDFMYQGKFYGITGDVAAMLPMLEMVGGKFTFIDEVLYVYNCVTMLNDYKTKLQQQIHIDKVIRSKEKYAPLKTPYRVIEKNQKADIIIIAQHTSDQLYILLESIQNYMLEIGNIYIIYNNQNKMQYKKIQQIFPQYNFISLDNIKSNLKSVLEHTIKTSPNKYVILATDNLRVKNFVNLNKCIAVMEQTYSYGFYLSLGKNIKENNYLSRPQHIPPHIEIENNVYAWQFQYGEQDWRNPNNLFMTIYKKTDIIDVIKELQYTSDSSLEYAWNKQIFDMEQTGLFFKESKIEYQ